jgi:hypothetical protein
VNSRELEGEMNLVSVLIDVNLGETRSISSMGCYVNFESLTKLERKVLQLSACYVDLLQARVREL